MSDATFGASSSVQPKGKAKGKALPKKKGAAKKVAGNGGNSSKLLQPRIAASDAFGPTASCPAHVSLDMRGSLTSNKSLEGFMDSIEEDDGEAVQSPELMAIEQTRVETSESLEIIEEEVAPTAPGIEETEEPPETRKRGVGFAEDIGNGNGGQRASVDSSGVIEQAGIIRNRKAGMPERQATYMTINSACQPSQTTRTLSKELVSALDGLQLHQSAFVVHKKFSEHDEDHEHGDGHGHGGHGHGGHHEHPVAVHTAVISAFINFTLMFGLCCVYGLVIFYDDKHHEHRAIAVKMSVLTGCVMGVITSVRTRAPISIAGPDFNAVIFLGGFVENIADQLGDVEDYQEKLLATTMFSIFFCTLTFCIVFITTGHRRLSKIVTHLPVSIVEAFLSCVGYKVFKYAVKMCKNDPWQFMPAAIMGVPLYFIKAYHLFGNPAIVVPAVLFLPLFFFYGCLLVSGWSVETARKWKYMYPKIDDVPFWHIWVDSFGSADQISITGWLSTIPDLIVMLVVCVLDCLLQMAVTELKVPMKITDKDYELKLYGIGNAACSLFCAPVGYGQLKFTALNYGILGNILDRRAGLLYAFACGVIFFVPGTTGILDYMPRIFLGAMLFFAGTGFIVEHLWASRKILSFQEWIVILGILCVFVVTNSLLYVLVAGVLFSGISFIHTYAKVPCVLWKANGNEMRSCVHLEDFLERKLQNILGNWVLILGLKGYIFYGSHDSIINPIKERLEFDKDIPKHAKLHYVIFECKLLDGMDASGAKALQLLAKECKNAGVRIMWAAVTEEMDLELSDRQVIEDEADTFEDLDSALRELDGLALSRCAELQTKWLSLHPTFQESHMLREAQQRFEPFSNVFLDNSSRHGCVLQYCRVKVLNKNTVLWERGHFHNTLYLLHTAEVAYFPELPENSSQKWPLPGAIFGSGNFVNCEVLSRHPARSFAVCIEEGTAICWDPSAWERMQQERPKMAREITRAVMRAQDRESSRLHERLGVLYQEKCASRVSLPGEEMLDQQLRECMLAQAFGAFGLFDPLPESDSGFRPQPPKVLEQDLNTAFNAVSHNGQLPESRVMKALHYAAVFPETSPTIKNKLLSKEDFLNLATEVMMHPLAADKLQKLNEGFKGASDNPNGIDSMEFGSLFCKLFPGILLKDEEVQSLFFEFDFTGDGRLDQDGFIAAISRLAYSTRGEWELMSALKDFTGSLLPETVSVEQLADYAERKGIDLEGTSASELIWCASSVADESDPSPSTISLRDLMAELLTVNHSSLHINEMGCHNVGHHFAMKEAQRKKRSTHSLGTRTSLPTGPPSRVTMYIDEGFGEHEVYIPETWQAKLHVILEDPRNCQYSWAWFRFSIFLVGLSTVFILLETFPELQDATHSWGWFACEGIITFFFAGEYFLRLYVCTALKTMRRRDFIVCPMNLLDFIAILPFFLKMAIMLGWNNAPKALNAFRLTRLARFNRFARLGDSHAARLAGPIALILGVTLGVYYKEAAKKG